MKARILDSVDVLKIVDLLSEQGYEVVAPFHREGQDSYFDVVTPANRHAVRIHLPNPLYPPKRFIFPHIERLMTFRQVNGDLQIQATHEEPRRAIFGIRSCDLAGIGHLDRYFLGREFRDTYYEKRRRHALLINVVCSDPQRDVGDDCFCVCADTGPAAREHFDLQLMDLGRGEFMAVAGSPAGQALFQSPIFRKAKPAHVERRRAILAEVRKRFKTHTSWFSAAVRYLSQDKVTERTWEEIGNRCMECGGCTYVCPACTCFTVSDRPIGDGQTERVRIWDSCALAGFTRMAGGFNPRRAVHDRRNRRFFRKLAHYFVQRELSMACVGCGRCVTVCHGNIGMPSVVEMLRRTTAGVQEHEPAIR
ncbi:MAG: 4Fe-4S dicluster domain-containing protein [Phycisphaeraceae bacterium]|nr:4Fe-4S dicluster domain-containing protein [Phycisphaeraceae bacterium]